MSKSVLSPFKDWGARLRLETVGKKREEKISSENVV